MHALTEQDATDEDLMEGVLRGRVEDLDRLYTRHHQALYTLCYRLTGSRDSAEDVVQDVFLKILKYHRSFRPGSRFVPWAFRIARNAAAHRHSKEARFTPLEAELSIAAETSDPVDVLHREVEHQLLERALAALDPVIRELIVLARFEGRNYAELAREYSVTEGAIKVRVFRALQRLRHEYLRLSKGIGS